MGFNLFWADIFKLQGNENKEAIVSDFWDSKRLK
jgi:hypothetical protein